MNRFFSAAAATATTLFLFTAAAQPVYAQSGAAYSLTPATTVAANTVVTGETLWKCSGDSCFAAKSTSRPAIVCAQAAKKVGKLSSFTANGQTFSDEELAKCNAKAR
jgi:hypothetical protein